MWRFARTRLADWFTLFTMFGMFGMLAICALGGCAASPTTDVRTSPSPTTAATSPHGSASPTPGASPTPTFAVVAGAPDVSGSPCQAQQLSLSLLIDKGNGVEQIGMKNGSSSVCWLYGFPGVELFDAQPAPIRLQVFKSTSDFGGVSPEQYVQVAPGNSAYVFVKWSVTPTGVDTTCTTAKSLMMVLSDGSTTRVGDPIQVCGDSITISPFQNAPAMAS